MAMKRYKSADDFFKAQTAWKAELAALRKILKSTPLEETVKWSSPCYTYDGKNVVGISGFKSYFGLWFHQGALLEDKRQVLINAQEGKTKALRQWRMTSGNEIKPTVIKAYVKEAIQLVKDGNEIKPASKGAVVVPELLKKALSRNKKAAAAFKKMTPGKQREYTEYIDQAKRETTKESRVAKIIPMIAEGAGLNDRYR
ncbi:MAG: DUF1801 domain-containing protein [Planctomycetota bacterium]